MSSKVRLTFGWWGDGQTWPEAPHDACLGETVLGPAGLLETVETVLGLGGPYISDARRIAEWQARMRACDDGSRVWSASFQADPWATARVMLALRDQLVDANWIPSILGSRRLRDIAAVEEREEPLARGLVDRIRGAESAIRDGMNLPIESLLLIDPMQSLPAGWRKLVRKLSSNGVAISQRPDFPAVAEGDLASLQQSGDVPRAMAGDGSLQILLGGTELIAAECLAGWLASQSAEESTVVIAGQSTQLLDAYLANRGLPRIGQTDRSAFRGGLQMLQLAFAACWKPFDPRPLLDLLLLPSPPLPRRIAREFAQLLRERPGQGHSSWDAAWQVAADWIAQHVESDSRVSPQQRLSDWRDWIEPERFAPEPGIPRDVAIGVCRRVQQWAHGRDSDGNDPVLVRLNQAADDLVQAMMATGLTHFGRTLLERILDQVIADGLENPFAIAEASKWTAIKHPGAIWAPAKRVVWWGFVDPTELPKTVLWPEADKRILQAAGCELDPPRVALERHSAAWRRGILAATKQLILVRPDGPKSPMHPIWDEFGRNLPSSEGAKITSRCEGVLHMERPLIAGRTWDRTPIAHRATPQSRRYWHAPLPIAVPPSTSPSAMEELLSCPLRWSLMRLLRLRRAALQRLAHEEQLLGNLAHEIAVRVFTAGQVPAPDRAEALARRWFDELVPQIAAPLVLPGGSALYAEAEQQIPHAIRELARQLGDGGLVIAGCEVARAAVLEDGTEVNGRIDVLAMNRSREPVVLDLKWARHEKYYRDKLESGEAIQLAAYTHLVGADQEHSSAAYYLIRHSALLSSAGGSFSAATQVQGPNMASTWQATLDAWQLRQEAIRNGRFLAPGVQAPEGTEDVDPAPTLRPRPPCHYCEYKVVCDGSQAEN